MVQIIFPQDLDHKMIHRDFVKQSLYITTTGMLYNCFSIYPVISVQNWYLEQLDNLHAEKPSNNIRPGFIAHAMLF